MDPGGEGGMERCVPLNNKLWIDEHVCKHCKVWDEQSWLDMKMCASHVPRDKQEKQQSEETRTLTNSEEKQGPKTESEEC